MITKLRKFLVSAKRNTYAKAIKPKVLEDGFEELTYDKGKYSYRDRYKGSIVKDKNLSLNTENSGFQSRQKCNCQHF